jgi:uncharacterized membrane protein (DUF373 family)
MSFQDRIAKAMLWFEAFTVTALQFLTVIMIAVSTAVLFVLAVATLRDNVPHIASVGELLIRVQRSIAGILVVVMGLEVLETLKIYLRDHYVRLEVILIVAVIAVCRQVVELDFEHTNGMLLGGLSALIASLTLGYFLVRRVHNGGSRKDTGQP